MVLNIYKNILYTLNIILNNIISFTYFSNRVLFRIKKIIFLIKIFVL